MNRVGNINHICVCISFTQESLQGGGPNSGFGPRWCWAVGLRRECPWEEETSSCVPIRENSTSGSRRHAHSVSYWNWPSRWTFVLFPYVIVALKERPYMSNCLLMFSGLHFRLQRWGSSWARHVRGRVWDGSWKGYSGWEGGPGVCRGQSHSWTHRGWISVYLGLLQGW